jgi:hypothetical protein
MHWGLFDLWCRHGHWHINPARAPYSLQLERKVASAITLPVAVVAIAFAERLGHRLRCGRRRGRPAFRLSAAQQSAIVNPLAPLDAPRRADFIQALGAQLVGRASVGDGSCGSFCGGCRGDISARPRRRGATS